MQARESSKDGPEFAGGPTTCFGSACGRGERRVDAVDINGKIHGRVADGVADFLDYPIRANSIDLPRLDPVKSRLVVVVVIFRPAESSADRPVLGKTIN